MPTACMEVETNSEILIPKKKAVLGPDNDKTVVILVTWETEITEDLRHRVILFAKMNLVGTSTKSVATPAAKAQERLDKERTLFNKLHV